MEQQKHKKCGIIILDSCALMKMEGNKVDLLSIFGALSQHGFDVLIPETIAVESNATLADGTELQQFFGHHAYKNSVIKPLMRAAAKANELPNLRIVPQTGPDAADDYCAALKMGTDKFFSRREVQINLAAAHRNHKKKDLGDDAILSLATRIRDNGETLPIFVITDDFAFKEQLNKAHIESLSHRCFSNCLSEAKIDQALGLALRRHDIVEVNNHFKGKLHGIDKAILAEQQSPIAQKGDATTGDPAVGLNRFTQKFGGFRLKPSNDRNGGNGGVGGVG